MPYTTLQKFLPAIQTLSIDSSLTKKDLLTKSFLMARDGDIKMYYAPHNEYINKKAQIVIVGITPGWTQMKVAYHQFIKSFTSGDHLVTCLFKAKVAAGFAGSMRTNLLYMLDHSGIPKSFDISHSSDLFEKNRHLLHTTAIIKYPVFLNEKNYTGYRPSTEHSSLLRHYAYSIFPYELSQITPPALIIPLGKTVEKVVFKLLKEKKLPNHHYLTGFPHPSGANGHRIKQFQHQKRQLRENVYKWSRKLKKPLS